MALVEETTNMSLEDNENAHHDTEQVDGKVKTQEGDSAVQNGHNAPENKEKKKQEREVIPLEELTPVPKPDKAGYEKRINELNQKIEHIKEEKNKVHTKIEEKREASKGLRVRSREMSLAGGHPFFPLYFLSFGMLYEPFILIEKERKKN